MRLIFCLCAAFSALIPSSAAYDNGLIIKTTSGTVHGKVDDSTPHVRQFLGVPYAVPPVGELRWTAPRALNNTHNKVINATQLGPSCPQNPSTGRSVWTLDAPDLLTYGPKSEDCLSVSIWAPKDIHEPLPVFIWLYGGAWSSGGADVPYQIPAQWVERSQAHIVVEVNYRVNIFGFPGSAALSQNNLGLLDQRAAIEWTQKNIANFGGDVERMVLWGQSAGAGSVDIQNMAYPDDPIVNGFIADSGSVFLIIRSTDTDSFSTVAAGFNCSNTDAKEELECLKTVPWQDLETFVNATSGLSFAPFVDNEIVFENYTERYLQGGVSSKPAVFGSNSREGYAIASYPDDPATEAPDAATADYFTDYCFLCPIPYSANLRGELGLKTYQYEYEGNFSNISPEWWLGAFHSAELPLIFGTYGLNGPPTSFEIQTSHTMQDFWLEFARNPENPRGWASWQQGLLQVFGGETVQGKNASVQILPVDAVDSVCTSTIYESILAGTNVF